MPNFYSIIQAERRTAQLTNHRQLIQLTGSIEWVMDRAQSLTQNSQYFWIGDAPQHIVASQYKQLLGQECDLLIINAHHEFDANTFAAAEGTLKGSGLLILLSPPTGNSNFDRYVQAQLNDLPFIQLSENSLSKDTSTSLFTTIETNRIKYPLNLNQQGDAIQAIIKTVTGHRRRPLVLTANRGRGKSAALGIAAKELIESGVKKILICAPNKQATTTLFKHAGTSGRITFIAPDLLLRTKPECDLLIIDEAAALPVPMLEALTKHYSRLVFSTTLHGYEGSGRGFALRFQKILKQIAPDFRTLHLDQPIRWAKNDPLESFTLNSLCLTEPNQPTLCYEPGQPVEFFQVSQNELLKDKGLLQSVFSLLVTAHYQTKPSDLKMLLNDTDLSIFVFRQKNQLLGVTLVNQEGELDDALSTKIYQGERRLKGHLIPQSLTFHCAQKQAAIHKYARIQRVAIHPLIQQQGLGTLFIEKISHWAETKRFDHLCSAFGATTELFNFWQKNHFSTLRIGNTRDKSSGTHSFIMNSPISEKGKLLHTVIQSQFQQQLSNQINRQLQTITPAIIAMLLNELANKQYNHPLIDSYCNGNLPYEFSEYHLLQMLMTTDFSFLESKQKSLCIQKILQNQSWADICHHGKYTGKKQAQQALRSAILSIRNTTRN